MSTQVAPAPPLKAPKQGQDMGDPWANGKVDEGRDGERATLNGEETTEGSWWEKCCLGVESENLFDDGTREDPHNWLMQQPDDPHGFPLFDPRAAEWKNFNMVVIACVIYSAVITPVEVAWKLDEVGLNVIGIIQDLFFLTLIPITLNTVIWEGIEIITDREKIARAYASSGFLYIDILASIPWSLIGTSGSGLEVAPALRGLRLLKLLRIHKAFQTRIFQPEMLLLRLGLIYFILAHYTGCVWWALWTSPAGEEVIYIGRHQPVGYGPIPSLQACAFWEQYAVSLYWGFSVLSGLGSNMVPAADNGIETFHAIVISYLGTFLVAYIVGEVYTTATTLMGPTVRWTAQMTMLKEWASARNMPQELLDKIKLHHEAAFDQLQGVPEADLMAQIPLCLRKEVSRHVGHSLLLKSDIFKALPDSFVETTATFMSSCVISKGSDVVCAGDVAEEMFFINRGVVEVVVPINGKDTVVATLSDGNCFGEAALITNSLRSATVRSATDVELFTLKRADFDHILSFSEELRTSMQIIALMRTSPKLRHKFKLLMQECAGAPWTYAQQLIRSWSKNCADAALAKQFTSYFGAEHTAVTANSDNHVTSIRATGLAASIVIDLSAGQGEDNNGTGKNLGKSHDQILVSPLSSDEGEDAERRSLFVGGSNTNTATKVTAATEDDSHAGTGLSTMEVAACVQDAMAPMIQMLTQLQQEQEALRSDVAELIRRQGGASSVADWNESRRSRRQTRVEASRGSDRVSDRAFEM